MTYGDVILALTGGAKTAYGVTIDVPQQAGKAFGENYVFDFSEITPLIQTEQRINTNLVSLADFVQELNLQHEKLFRSICYLGPLRTKAERLYSWTGIEPESVGYAGENTVAAMLAARSRKISQIPTR